MVSLATTATCPSLTTTSSGRDYQPATAPVARPRTALLHPLRQCARFIPSAKTTSRSWGQWPGQRRSRLAVSRAAAVDAEEEIALVEEDAMERMEKSLERIKGNFNTVRTGRATPSLLDRVEVEYYGTNVVLKSIAQVSTPDSSTLLITPFDKSSIKSIEKALLTSDVGLTPNSDGTVIRLSVPQLTQERRKELLKTVSKLAEDGKVSLRNVRRDAIKQYDRLEKEKKISEDDKKGFTDSLQKMTDEYVKSVDTLFKQKEKELLKV